MGNLREIFCVFVIQSGVSQEKPDFSASYRPYVYATPDQNLSIGFLRQRSVGISRQDAEII
jgi:hypothetical protein